MLRILVSAEEIYHEETQEFTKVGGTTLEMEHSLLSLSKWESKFQKPFLDQVEKTSEEVLAYIYMMILTEDVSEDIIMQLSNENIQQIKDYIDSSQSATIFYDTQQRPGKKETITSELVYYWLLSFNIPFECESWHLNRLFSLIRICGIKNSSDNKMSKKETAAYNKALNEQRRAQLGTSG